MMNHNKNSKSSAQESVAFSLGRFLNPLFIFFKKLKGGLHAFFYEFKNDPIAEENKEDVLLDAVAVLRHAKAMRVIFYYPGEEGSYVDDAIVTLFENGIVHIEAESEVTTTTLSHCEIIWKFKGDETSNTPGLRLLKFPERQKEETGTDHPNVPKK